MYVLLSFSRQTYAKGAHVSKRSGMISRKYGKLAPWPPSSSFEPSPPAPGTCAILFYNNILPSLTPQSKRRPRPRPQMGRGQPPARVYLSIGPGLNPNVQRPSESPGKTGGYSGTTSAVSRCRRRCKVHFSQQSAGAGVAAKFTSLS